MPTPRHAHALVVFRGKILALGGFGMGHPLATIEEYDPATDRSTKKTDTLTRRGFFGAGVVDGRIYAIAGRTKEIGPIERYDPAMDRWQLFDSIPARRNRFGSVVLGEAIYLIGGEPARESGWDWSKDTTCYRPIK
jgi:hypothetical protein